MGFVGQHLLFRAPAAPALLATQFFEPGALRLLALLLPGFELVQQELKGEHTVESLLTRGLALDLQSGRAVNQHHTRGRLVDVLSAVSTGADEGLFDLGLAHAQRGHAVRKLRFLSGTGRVHAGSVAVDSDAIKTKPKRLDSDDDSLMMYL